MDSPREQDSGSTAGSLGTSTATTQLRGGANVVHKAVEAARPSVAAEGSQHQPRPTNTHHAGGEERERRDTKHIGWSKISSA